MIRPCLIAWLNTKETHRQALPSHQDDRPNRAGDVQRRIRALWATMQADCFRPSQPQSHFVLDARQNPGLLERTGQVQALSRIAQALHGKPGPLPSTVYVDVQLPDRAWADRLTRSVEAGNRVVRSEGIVNGFKHRTLRFATGVAGRAHPVRYETIGEAAHCRIRLAVNLSDLEKDDLLKFASFMNRYGGG